MSQHPKYADMVLAAVKALGGKGASRQAINKYVVKEFNLTENKHHHAMLNQALKRCSAPKGTLVHSKGKGAAGSFKVRAAVPESKTKKAAAKPKQDKKTKTEPAKKLPKKAPKKATPEKPKETKPETKPEPARSAPPKPKSPKVKRSKKSKAASPKKPKVVKTKKTPKKATTKKVVSKK
ncbi:histone H1-like [Actinia tenebrosa]|uniref:Histone H1-like n=1 Tax=Actinia tenebrosa TaxID=6105 RepID=A0A6P8HXF1_ACTTE|nr:histone H1-like [Actinia tenebrosa]XP_031561049.1 histone H1-like [Actinia tenebrosa]